MLLLDQAKAQHMHGVLHRRALHISAWRAARLDDPGHGAE